MNTQRLLRRRNREGVILMLMVVLLPVLIILSAIAINLAQLELVNTELQIATDVATRGGGAAWTETGDINEAVEAALLVASLNDVHNEPYVLARENVVFGSAARPDQGRYVFTAADPQPDPENVRANQVLISSIQVSGSVDTNLFFRVGEVSNVLQAASAVTSQVNRDIVLVADRSGSMAYFEDEQFLYNTFTRIYNCLLYTSPSPRDQRGSRMPSSA